MSSEPTTPRSSRCPACNPLVCSDKAVVCYAHTVAELVEATLGSYDRSSPTSSFFDQDYEAWMTRKVTDGTMR